MLRAVLIAFAAATLITMWLDIPQPVKPIQVDYCWVNYKAAAKDPLGNWHTGWTGGFGPCVLLDRYENI